MRLVRDDDVEVMQEPQPIEVEKTRVTSEEPDSAPDGTIDGGIDEAEDDSSPAADVQVDLRTLEALLFSTHSPLTAGRLAELLELESTRPIKRAIRELNEQYWTGDRSFRVAQVAGGYQLLT